MMNALHFAARPEWSSFLVAELSEVTKKSENGGRKSCPNKIFKSLQVLIVAEDRFLGKSRKPHSKKLDNLHID